MTRSSRANFGHVGGQWATLFETPTLGDRLVARNILNAQLAWEHKSWTVTAYGPNLTNQHYPAALNSGLHFAGAPRQYGVKLLKISDPLRPAVAAVGYSVPPSVYGAMQAYGLTVDKFLDHAAQWFHDHGIVGDKRGTGRHGSIMRDCAIAATGCRAHCSRSA